MKMRLALLLALFVLSTAPGCRTPRLGWRGNRCSPSPSLLRRPTLGAFQGTACEPTCGAPNFSGYVPGAYEVQPGVGNGWQATDDGYSSIPPGGVESRNYFPGEILGGTITTPGPEADGIPSAPSSP